MQAKKKGDPLIKADIDQKEDVIEIAIDDPEDEWRCIQQMINALFNEKENKLRTSDNNSKARAFMSIQPEILGAMEFFAQKALAEAKDTDFKRNQKANMSGKNSLLEELNIEFLKLSDVKLRSFLTVQLHVAELCERTEELVLQQKAEARKLKTVGGETKKKTGKERAEHDLIVEEPEAYAEEKEKDEKTTNNGNKGHDTKENGTNETEKKRCATATNEKDVKTNVDGADRVLNEGTDAVNDGTNGKKIWIQWSTKKDREWVENALSSLWWQNEKT